MKILKTVILSSLTCLVAHVFSGAQSSINPMPATKTDRFDEFKQRAVAHAEGELDLLKPLQG